MIVIKAIGVFVGALLLSAVLWSLGLFMFASVLGASMAEAGDFESTLAFPLALVTASIVTYRWWKSRHPSGYRDPLNNPINRKDH